MSYIFNSMLQTSRNTTSSSSSSVPLKIVPPPSENQTTRQPRKPASERQEFTTKNTCKDDTPKKQINPSPPTSMETLHVPCDQPSGSQIITDTHTHKG